MTISTRNSYYKAMDLIERIKLLDVEQAAKWSLSGVHLRENLVMDLLFLGEQDGVEMERARAQREARELDCMAENNGDHVWELMSKSEQAQRGYKDYRCSGCGKTRFVDSSD